MTQKPMRSEAERDINPNLFVKGAVTPKNAGFGDELQL